jgi:hypothetical protein
MAAGPESGKITRCKGCGIVILWARAPEGGAIPLDPRAIVYEVHEGPGGTLQASKAPRLGKDQKHGFAVSHFATCPKANEFSGTAAKAPLPLRHVEASGGTEVKP